MNEDLLDQTADIVCAHVSNNHVSIETLPKFIATVHRGLQSVTALKVGALSQQVAE